MTRRNTYPLPMTVVHAIAAGFVDRRLIQPIGRSHSGSSLGSRTSRSTRRGCSALFGVGAARQSRPHTATDTVTSIGTARPKNATDQSVAASTSAAT